MVGKAERLIFLGFDGAIPGFLNKFLAEGKLPNIDRLVKGGFYTEAFPCPPCDTPTNWTTLVTGAWPGTHGITSFHTHLPGEPLSEGMKGCRDTGLCNAEFIWDVAERSGRRSFIFDYPAGWPPTAKTSLVVGGWYSSGRGPGAGLFGFAPNEIGLKDTHPPELAEELRRGVGPVEPIVHPRRAEMVEKGFTGEMEAFFEALDYRIDYFVETAKYLQGKYGWDLLVSHIHTEDSLNHRILNRVWMDHPNYSRGEAEGAWGIYERSYVMLDGMVGRILKECGDERTLVVIVSDHGGVPSSKIAWVGNALRRAGLLRYRRDEETGSLVVDWQRTKAAFYFSPPEYVWINLEGREPNGIVRPEDYERVRGEVINALYSTRDPETGECPVSLALRKEEAAMFGHWGERCADIIYFVKAQYFLPDFGFDGSIGKTSSASLEYLMDMGDVGRPDPTIAAMIEQGSHHGHLPTDGLGLTSNLSFLIMNGPGVRRKHRGRPIWLTDVAPTMAYLLGLPQPAHSEGNIIADTTCEEPKA
jgi:predicted AlkP superfamily phosphohydrolase/phosphomutase